MFEVNALCIPDIRQQIDRFGKKLKLAFLVNKFGQIKLGLNFNFKQIGYFVGAECL